MAVINDYAVGNLNAIADKLEKLNRFAIKYTRGPVILTDITWPTASAITYGQTLGESPLAGGSARTPWGTTVTGTFEWSEPESILGAGNRTPDVSFIPDQHQRFAAEPVPVALTIDKATPTVSTWPTRGAITYGQTLGDSVFTGGTASVAGGFAWVNPATVPDPGTPSYNLRFTPTDSANYNTVTVSRNITVNKADPTVVTWPTANPVNNGSALSTITWATSGVVTGIGGVPLPGAFGWASPGTIPTSNGNQTARFTPTDTSKYNLVDGNVHVSILYTSLSGWTNRANGGTSTVDLTGATLVSAKIQWRGATLLGAEQHTSNIRSGSETLAIGKVVEIPTVNSSLQSFTRHRGYVYHIHANGGKKCVHWPPRPGGVENCSWNASTSHEHFTATHYSGDAYLSAAYDGFGGSWTYGSWVASVRTYWKYRLNTTHPSITRSGKSVSLIGVLGSLVESAWFDLVQGGSSLLTSGVVNTLTHNCSAYSDTSGGASGQLWFRIEYKYTTG